MTTVVYLSKLTTILFRLPNKMGERVRQYLESGYSIYGAFDGDKPCWLNPDGSLTQQPKSAVTTEIE